jgi:phosphomannomutase / phosphoglucomutase
MNHAERLPAAMFRAYDIRGIAGEDLTENNIYIIGFAIGSLAIEHGVSCIVFGADGRLSSPALARALTNGILDSGCDIIDLGIIPTPLLYFATHTTECSSGVMLTASHNPSDYNGIKIVRERSCLTPAQIQTIRERSLSIMSEPDKARPGNRGHLSQHDILPAYLALVAGDIQLKRPLRIVVDCGNAVPGLVAPVLLEKIGCEVIPLFCELDGRFPNHHPDPTIAENLQSLITTVLAHQADAGIALDGDGDRVIVVTNEGHIIDTDRLLMLFVRDILPRYDNPCAVYDVKCSNLVSSEIEACGGRPIISRSGHSFMKIKMQETGAVVGAEFSAHVFIRDRWFGYDDGVYVAARFLEILAGSGASAESLLLCLPQSVVTPELRINVAEERKFELMERISGLARFPAARISRLDGVRADFQDGWGLIRASNTTPALLLRFEASNLPALKQIEDAFRKLLQQVDEQLDFQL